ncbi:hypothetical protein GCM10010124_25960 [Pilimelia terevasa]|uniref:Uncharacterized protein n=1 Tax=Pilimelia terevasa TaxID=53372 RepID=A0A8J3FL43_9ACTN|nr:hypothetical protein [Pilimelia terevasa]GGK31997.1 hypothetical protein GCM10010124_25960 [Pilimelia terevasa]
MPTPTRGTTRADSAAHGEQHRPHGHHHDSEPDAITALRTTIGAIHMHATGVAPVDLDREMDRAARLLDQLSAALTGQHDQCGPGAHTCTEGETR